MLIALFGTLLVYLTVVQPITKKVAAERNRAIYAQLKQDKIQALKRRHPILRLWSNAQLEEEFNIDRLYYGGR